MSLIIGITGSLVSGKGALAKLIVAQKFKLLSFGEEVRDFIDENLEERGPNNRERQQFWGNEARIIYRINFWTDRLWGSYRVNLNY